MNISGERVSRYGRKGTVKDDPDKYNVLVQWDDRGKGEPFPYGWWAMPESWEPRTQLLRLKEIPRAGVE